ncbi:hypothetical protein GCM10009837_72050 [Streptomyces durmitorensis]|uniref:Uncharacterized protein n=1 Tax=Streptomyces durmitorensis TaxID=319947 RepID=A0ABY4PLL5_9ACTN|nr:hypothetical protein [Streptomyces durmitorensis]UQT54044.1 hypothetical protein M4V62_02545 [Streptomyces durmitorensis]
MWCTEWPPFNRYDLGSAHPLVGSTAPDFRADHALRRAACGVRRAAYGVRRAACGVRRAAKNWGDRIRYTAGPARDGLGFAAVLVRPDGVVAWASGEALEPDAFEQAAAHWLGSPQNQPGAPCPCRLHLGGPGKVLKFKWDELHARIGAPIEDD